MRVQEAADDVTEIASRLRLVVGRLSRRIRIDGRESVPPLQLSALLVATVLTSPHLFLYDVLLLTLPAVLWHCAAINEPVTRATSSIRTLLAAGFIWLAFSGAVAATVPLQLTTPLMLLWLLILHRALREPKLAMTPVAA